MHRVTTRSAHISYNEADHENRNATRDALLRIARTACELQGAERSAFRILDAGCGLGLLIRDLRREGFEQVDGMDMDDVCLESAGRFGNAIRGDVAHLSSGIGGKSYDLVILSHVLEHMPDPVRVLHEAAQIATWVAVAVPNPIRPHIVAKYALRSRDYSNKGHYYSWDRSHLTNFVERFTPAHIVSWEQDAVKLVPFRPIRRLMRSIGLLSAMETRWLPRVFPYFSTSLIFLARLDDAQQSHV